MIIQVENIFFYLNSEDEVLGTIHAKMIQDFKDEKKLNYFKELLLNNPDTAFTIYNKL